MAGMHYIVNGRYSQKETPMNLALLQHKWRVISNEPDFISMCFKYNLVDLVCVSTSPHLHRSSNWMPISITNATTEAIKPFNCQLVGLVRNPVGVQLEILRRGIIEAISVLGNEDCEEGNQQVFWRSNLLGLKGRHKASWRGFSCTDNDTKTNF